MTDPSNMNILVGLISKRVEILVRDAMLEQHQKITDLFDRLVEDPRRESTRIARRRQTYSCSNAKSISALEDDAAESVLHHGLGTPSKTDASLPRTLTDDAFHCGCSSRGMKSACSTYGNKLGGDCKTPVAKASHKYSSEEKFPVVAWSCSECETPNWTHACKGNQAKTHALTTNMFVDTARASAFRSDKSEERPLNCNSPQQELQQNNLWVPLGVPDSDKPVTPHSSDVPNTTCRSNHSNMQLCQLHAAELTKIVIDEESERIATGVLRQSHLLYISGVLPWKSPHSLVICTPSVWYQWLLILLLLASAVMAICNCHSYLTTGHRVFWGHGLLLDLPLALGSLFGLLFFETPVGSRRLVDCNRMFTVFATRADLIERWHAKTLCNVSMILTFWISAVLCRAYGEGLFQSVSSLQSLIQTVLFAFIAFEILCLTHCLLCICHFLILLVDTFGCRVFDRLENIDAFQEWNMLVAVLQQTTRTIERSLFSLQLAVIMFVLFSPIDILVRNTGLPVVASGALVIAPVMWVFVSAAAVSDRCSRLPSLINTLSFAYELNHTGKDLVAHMTHSQAGIYVFNIRLTTSVMMKSLYLWIVISCGLAIHVYSKWDVRSNE